MGRWDGAGTLWELDLKALHFGDAAKRKHLSFASQIVCVSSFRESSLALPVATPLLRRSVLPTTKPPLALQEAKWGGNTVKKEEISCRAHASSIRRSPSRHVCAIRGKGEDAEAEHKEKFRGVWDWKEREREREKDSENVGRGLKEVESISV
ncbi:hypothetical protein X777_12593 [Ooceraea biroi]|uniref:Uncharacterized protein n=1 Tax=Ooceraea biroi TaxID=2015173 RepID=A0A026W2C4_OOCBI|nr:hypothetical protein X777_12593 [Ooceraea biroi]